MKTGARVYESSIDHKTVHRRRAQYTQKQQEKGDGAGDRSTVPLDTTSSVADNVITAESVTPHERETAVLNYATQKRALMPLLALTYALHFTGDTVWAWYRHYCDLTGVEETVSRTTTSTTTSTSSTSSSTTTRSSSRSSSKSSAHMKKIEEALVPLSAAAAFLPDLHGATSRYPNTLIASI